MPASCVLAMDHGGVIQLVECNLSVEADDVLRVDLAPLVEALGLVLDRDGEDYGIVVIRGTARPPSDRSSDPGGPPG